MRFPSDFLDEIRAKLPISNVIGQRVTFDSKKSKPSRGDFWCCCPFHKEKTPSFHCDDRHGRYYCFGCGVSGDVFTFLCEKEGLSFPEAVERLANSAGIKLPILDLQSHKHETQKSDLYRVMERATDFFQQSLHMREGEQVLRYLEARGVTRDLIERFRIGFAPAGRTALKDALSAHGILEKQMEECGLLVSGEGIGGSYDRFRNRIIFPIEDFRGHVVAFGGRALNEGAQVKYINSPETILFHKGDILYNAASARKHSHSVRGERDHPILVVEGYMDVIALAKVGFNTVVAPLGTALTDAQIRLLWQMSPDPVLCFDGDDAGLNAAFRAIDHILPLLKVGVSVRFVLLPRGKDPDEIIHSHGREFFTSLLKKPFPLVELLWWRSTHGKRFETPEERAGLEQSLKQKIATIKDERLRRYYLRDIKERLFNFFRSWPPKKGKATGYGNNQTTRVIQDLSFSRLARSDMARDSSYSIPIRESVILLVLAYHPKLWHENFEVLSQLKLKNPKLDIFHRSMLEILGDQKLHDGEDMVALLEKKGQKTLLEQMQSLVRSIGIRITFPGASIADARAVLKQALYLHLQGYHLHKGLRDIEEQLVDNLNSEAFNLLRDTKFELEQMRETEALIEGFGCWFDGKTDKSESS